MDIDGFLKKVPYEDFYRQNLEVSEERGSELRARCPFHPDEEPSLWVNKTTGLWHCFGCNAEGNVIQFVEKIQGCSFKDALKFLSTLYRIPLEKFERERPKIDSKLIETYVKNLFAEKQKNIISFLQEQKGLTLETIKRFQLGWDNYRITIPIYDENHLIVNFRRYSIESNQKKMISHSIRRVIDGKTVVQRYGEWRIFGIEEIKKRAKDLILICEGEWDKIIASQNGFLAITGTTGAGTFKEKAIELFKNREVVIIYDVDLAGKLGAENVCQLLSKVAKNIRKVKLPLSGTAVENDLSDYFLKLNKTKEDLSKLIEETPYFILHEEIKEKKGKVIPLSSFLQIDETSFIDKQVSVPIEISGETSEAFHAITKFKVDYCKRKEAGLCSQCTYPFTIEPGAKEFIESCMSDDAKVLGMLRAKACPFGQKPQIKILEKCTVREFFATQRVKRFLSRIGSEEELEHAGNLMERKIFFISDKPVKPGNYTAIGWIKTNPKTQQICFLAEKLKPLEEEFESFKLDDSSRADLKIFQKLSIKRKIKIIANQVLRLRKRENLILGILLTYFSPLQIYFNGENMRGWLNLLILGDSGTGKTAAVTRLGDFIGVGEIISGLTASRTGITYGLREFKGKGWQIKIGRFPANTKKILFIDELQYLKPEEIRTLGKGMEEGFITVDRIADHGSFDSRTRFIALANPKDDKTMDEHMFGCESLKKLFDTAITRRFDLALFTSHTDIRNIEDLNVNIKDLNSGECPITEQIIRNCVFWVWTRKVNQIKFLPQAIERILTRTIELSYLFGDAQDIPLVAPGDFRNKLARLSTAFAAFSISSDENMKKIIVQPTHVDFIADFIRDIYSGEKCGLLEYSEIYLHKIQMEDYTEIKKILEEKKESEKYGTTLEIIEESNLSKIEELLYTLKVNNFIRREDLAEQIGISIRSVSSYISLLRKFNLIDSRKEGYFKKPKFVKFLRKLARDEKTSLRITGRRRKEIPEDENNSDENYDDPDNIFGY